MGFWDFIYSVGDRVKGISPDLSTAKRAGSAAYNHTSAAVAKIDQVVRVDGPQYLRDDETRAQMGLFATTFAKHTANYFAREGFKQLIPGATVATKLLSDTMLEVNQKHKDGPQAMQAKVDDLKKSTSQPEISTTKDMIYMFM